MRIRIRQDDASPTRSVTLNTTLEPDLELSILLNPDPSILMNPGPVSSLLLNTDPDPNQDLL